MARIDDDDIVTVGDPLPELRDVIARDRFTIDLTWAMGRSAVVDLAPDLFTFKVYAPLRDDPALFKTVHVVNAGSAIAWGEDDVISMPATAIERLEAESMTTIDFQDLLESLKLTRDAAAAQLGISRRLVGYYAAGQTIPRSIALACRYLTIARAPD